MPRRPYRRVRSASVTEPPSNGRRTISVQFILGPEGTQVTATERVFGGRWRWDRDINTWTLPTRSTDPVTFSVDAAVKHLTEELRREL